MLILGGQAPGSIAAGELLGLPTETVYGLAADADNVQAIAKIFNAKRRPSNHPLIVHVLNEASAAHFAQAVPDFAHVLMRAFWPGPLTLILPRRPEVAAAAAGGAEFNRPALPFAPGGPGALIRLSGDCGRRGPAPSAGLGCGGRAIAPK